MEMFVQHYRLKALSEPEFEQQVAQIWQDLLHDLANSPETAGELDALGISVSEIRGKKLSELIEMRRGAAGLTGIETVIVNLIGGVALKLFDLYIIPLLKRGKDREAIQPDKKR